MCSETHDSPLTVMNKDAALCAAARAALWPCEGTKTRGLFNGFYFEKADTYGKSEGKISCNPRKSKTIYLYFGVQLSNAVSYFRPVVSRPKMSESYGECSSGAETQTRRCVEHRTCLAAWLTSPEKQRSGLRRSHVSVSGLFVPAAGRKLRFDGAFSTSHQCHDASNPSKCSPGFICMLFDS